MCLVSLMAQWTGCWLLERRQAGGGEQAGTAGQADLQAEQEASDQSTLGSASRYSLEAGDGSLVPGTHAPACQVGLEEPYGAGGDGRVGQLADLGEDVAVEHPVERLGVVSQLYKLISLY